MKRHLLSFMLPLLALAACEKPFEEQNLPEDNLIDKLEFTAEMEQIGAGTKTTIDAQNNVLWQAGDEIAIFNKNLKADKYVLKSGENTTNAMFTLSAEAEGKNPTEEYQYNLAVYPYTNFSLEPVVDANGDINNHAFTVNIPTYQQYVKDGIDKNALAMAAISEDTHFKFINLAGVLKFQLTGTQKVKTIKVLADWASDITGKFNSYDGLVATKDGKLSIAQKCNDFVVLDCPPEGIQLSTEPTTFHLAISPQELNLKLGFLLRIEFTDGTVKEVKAGESPKNVLYRNSILSFPVVNVVGKEVEKPLIDQIWIKTVGDVRPELTQKLLNAGCISISETINSQGYWILTFNSNNVLSNNFFSNDEKLKEVKFSEGFRHPIPFGAFKGCSNLTTINLEETQSIAILEQAFMNCTSLTSIVLPPTPGLDIDHPNIFRGSSLESIRIPANAALITNATGYFDSCKSLQSVVIESSVFAGYDSFAGCDKLTDISFLHKDISLQMNPDASIELFLNFDTSTRNLTLNENCKELPKVVKDSDKLSWYGFLWNSIKYVDDNGKPVKGPDPIPLPTPDTDGIHQASEVWVKTIDGLSPGPETNNFYVSKTANEKGYWVFTYKLFESYGFKNLYEENFTGNTRITEVILPSDITYIDFNAFKDCTNLKNVVFQNKSIEANSSSFYNTGFESIVIPANVSFPLGNYQTFAECADLTEATIHSSIFKITQAFNNCTKLTTLRFLAETLDITPEWGSPFDGITTTGIDLVINEKCSVPADGLTWAGKTWKSITKVKVDAEGNIIP